MSWVALAVMIKFEDHPIVDIVALILLSSGHGEVANEFEQILSLFTFFDYESLLSIIFEISH